MFSYDKGRDPRDLHALNLNAGGANANWFPRMEGSIDMVKRLAGRYFSPLTTKPAQADIKLEVLPRKDLRSDILLTPLKSFVSYDILDINHVSDCDNDLKIITKTNTHTARGGMDCVVCYERKPAKTFRFCIECKSGRVCAGCAKRMGKDADCPMCRCKGFGELEKGIQAPKKIRVGYSLCGYDRFHDKTMIAWLKLNNEHIQELNALYKSHTDSLVLQIATAYAYTDGEHYKAKQEKLIDLKKRVKKLENEILEINKSEITEEVIMDLQQEEREIACITEWLRYYKQLSVRLADKELLLKEHKIDALFELFTNKQYYPTSENMTPCSHYIRNYTWIDVKDLDNTEAHELQTTHSCSNKAVYYRTDLQEKLLKVNEMTYKYNWNIQQDRAVPIPPAKQSVIDEAISELSVEDLMKLIEAKKSGGGSAK